MSIADNLKRVQERIARAAEKAGRCASDITLVGVTKYVGPREAAELIAAGCHDLGESRPQELWKKYEALSEGSYEALSEGSRAGASPPPASCPQPQATSPPPPYIRWHLIGHLQRNKVARTLPLVSLIHSVDSERLLATINEARALPLPPKKGQDSNLPLPPGEGRGEGALPTKSLPQNRRGLAGHHRRDGRVESSEQNVPVPLFADGFGIGSNNIPPIPVLLEVNTSGEAAKHGLLPDAVEPILASAENHPHVQIHGLMTMAALEGGDAVAARCFATLRNLRDRLKQNTPPCVRLQELSMGMSGDFEIAIQEGATIVRVGSALWE